MQLVKANKTEIFNVEILLLFNFIKLIILSYQIVL